MRTSRPLFSPRAQSLILWGIACRALLGCERHVEPDVGEKKAVAPIVCSKEAEAGDLLINELVAKNEGVWIDESGATDDFIELVNASERLLHLSDFNISDDDGFYVLPDISLEAGARLLLWADNEDEGLLHLPFKLSSSGETLQLSSCERLIDRTTYPRLEENNSWARHPEATGEFSVCRYGSPEASNGETCAPPQRQGLLDDVKFADFNWSGPHPELPAALVISEMALKPASFIELENRGASDVDLGEYSLFVSPLFPGQALPGPTQGETVPLGVAILKPGERVAVTVLASHVSELNADLAFEGVVSLFQGDTSVDRVDFMRWPEGAALARPQDAPERLVFCKEKTPDASNECTMLESRDVGDRVRHLRTLSDFGALAEGGSTLSTAAVKFIVDVEQGELVHLLSARAWPLHFTFVHDVVEAKEALDRCDPVEQSEFNQGWYDFSVVNYFETVGRDFFLGTLVQHGSTGHKSVEFAFGDVILPEDMRRVFFLAAARTLAPFDWYLRPQNQAQVLKARQIEGHVPLISPQAPFSGLNYQPLTHGDGFGVLTFVSAADLKTSALGSQVILVTDDVPNDMPLVGGLITQAFQTPLAHVNVLSQNRGTPNMALRAGVADERIASHLGELVRLHVSGDNFTIESADAQQAQEFWDDFRHQGKTQVPRLNRSVTLLVDLKQADLSWIPIIGAKASQMAELYRVQASDSMPCPEVDLFQVPEDAFAIPMAHFLKHFSTSGAEFAFEEARKEPAFASDALVRINTLAKIQDMIRLAPVDPGFLSFLEKTVNEKFGSRRVRFRSSSNAEDLPGFNGAGLYTSKAARWGDPDRSIEDAVRTVWASLFNARAYDERELAGVEHSAVAMGVLVHEAFSLEAANGVGVSRDILDPIRGDIYYVNAQAGEASVTNPAPGTSTEELIYRLPPRTPRLTYQSLSGLARGDIVLKDEELDALACALRSVHEHFRPLIDPENEDEWFAMEVEFKLRSDSRELVVKQARPHAFGGFDVTFDCRSLNAGE